MDSFISIEIIWQDPDMVEILVKASNGKFYGETEVYTTYPDLVTFASSLEGFPPSVNDKVTYNAGEKDSYSFASIIIYCFTASGHTAALVEIEANIASNQRKEEKHQTKMEVQFEIQSLDSFRHKLVSLITNKSGIAVLHGIQPYT
ncbi:MAG: hypothetical protein KZQ88_03495 [Candidatus Thiodiazotropha sp. (ex Dulcina madagascariensis)]|nr:hypothetical protein [Candidatus Thiodiazotropha sp. (ex Dulcina madagascariensis)]MCU7925923.1 hypothetical protein [Candidatus Thiodiazotropha sp. (ex Dulcina madagascariensis)]